jgi:DNA-binding CsgD family transcriptional regulator
MLEVLRLLPDYNYQEIADIMVISVWTVKTQVRSLSEIFGVSGAKRLVVEAYRAGIIDIKKPCYGLIKG